MITYVKIRVCCEETRKVLCELFDGCNVYMECRVIVMIMLLYEVVSGEQYSLKWDYPHLYLLMQEESHNSSFERYLCMLSPRTSSDRICNVSTKFFFCAIESDDPHPPSIKFSLAFLLLLSYPFQWDYLFILRPLNAQTGSVSHRTTISRCFLKWCIPAGYSPENYYIQIRIVSSVPPFTNTSIVHNHFRVLFPFSQKL